MVPCWQDQTLVNAGNDIATCLVPFSDIFFPLIAFLLLMEVRSQLNLVIFCLWPLNKYELSSYMSLFHTVI
jgi:hypothetical protein